jgi:hypothetical protein
MSRIKGMKSSAALTVAVVALVAALGGGAVAGVTISKLNRGEKKQVKRISKRQARKLDRKIKSTNLFAYVRDSGGVEDATVEYGEGTSGVDDPAGGNDFFDPYVVTFDRNLAGCVAQATSGLGEPDGGTWTSSATGMFADVDGSTVRVYRSGGDGAFMVSVFC